ncbi:hypothetical protein ACFOTA_16540 [Chitinophaga sp. GCM10012297]|uniref:AsmA-like C-terminal domain-containing protein n=1 Tax=Chitinophaga chungangae TaxID=2821488 RepID=A0ABS3YGM0_9BACT|nr:hypothetical protein [Chitinophaga chungangae]MBO9153830.1 hypothetical protein [Chitinophaga chungangae]
MKKALKRILIFVTAGILLCAGLFYYLITFRFKESLRYAVKMQTKGRYEFNAGSAEISLDKRAIRLKTSSVRCVSPENDASAYQIIIPELYFSLASWKNLLLDRKMIVDSMAFINPQVKMNIRRKSSTGTPRAAFKGSDILHILEKTLTHFNARTFSMRGASYDYIVQDTTVLHVNDINLYVKNFTGVNNADDHLFGSDRVVLSLGRQRWVLPKRKQELSFNALRFDSKGQRLEVDSIDYREHDSAGNPGLHLRAEQVFFNSRHLPAVYQHNRLLIDTLNCLNPVLTVPPGKHGKPGQDTLLAGSRMPFGFMQVGFINVVNADVHLQGRQAASRNSNLRIYNLRVDPKVPRPLTIDSVRMDLRQMVFYSRDSLYQMRIDEFKIQKDGILFSGVTYSPTEKNHADKTVSATAPALKLKNVDFEALMRKHLKADEAELLDPVITQHRQAMKPGRKAATASPLRPSKNLDIFYQTLHGIREMVNVEHFRLRNGELGYKAGGEKGTALSVKKINAHILLNKLFLSDSLVDIKHSIPDLRVGNLELTARGMKIRSEDYRFDGVGRRSWSKRTEIRLPNGSMLLAQNVYWEVFDWDVYQQTRDIQVDYFRAGSILVVAKTDGKTKHEKPRRELPVIRVGKLEAGEAHVWQTTPDGRMIVNGGDLLIEQLRTDQHFFTWRSVRLKIHGMQMVKPGFTFETGAGHITTNGSSTLDSVGFVSTDRSIKFFSRQCRFQLPLHSTGFSNLYVPGLQVDGPVVQWVMKRKPGPGSPFKGIHLPFDLQVDKLRVNDARVALSAAGEKDTLKLDTRAQVDIGQIHGNKNGIAFQPAKITLRESVVRRGQMMLGLPFFVLDVSKGNVGEEIEFALQQLAWSGGELRYKKDSAAIAAEKLQGSLAPLTIRFGKNNSFDWKKLVPLLSVKGGKVHFSNGKMNAGADNFAWTDNRFLLQHIFMRPQRSRDETFSAEKWQQDYITVEEGELGISGFNPSQTGPLYIPKLSLEHLKMTVSRDKHMPLQHGIEKEMPTKLVSKIGLPFKVDTISISNSTIVYAERPAKTDHWNEMPITDVQGAIFRLGNRFNGGDSLLVIASGRVFNGSIQQLVYRESYGDSLSGFTASLHISPLSLPQLGRQAMPKGNVKITKGKIDTVLSRWDGNKYAAYGQMQFYYHDLRLRIGDKRHPGKWRPLPALKTGLANLLLPSRVSRPSFIFAERNQEKFIFNYWIVVQKNGVMSSLGLRRNRAYRKKYNKYRQQYSLPPLAVIP